MAKTDKPQKPAKKDGRLKQMRAGLQDHQEGRPEDRADPARHVRARPSLVGFALSSAGPARGWCFDIITGVLVGVLAMLIVFGRRAQRVAGQADRGPARRRGRGARHAPKRGWKTDQAIAFNRQQDVVHRVVGPPGIVLIGEGNPNRLRSLLTTERAQAPAGRRGDADPRDRRRVRRGRGPARQADPPRQQAEARGQAGRDDRRAPGSRRSTPPARRSRSPRGRCRPA